MSQGGGIPVEALLDLRRRLDDLPPRHAGKGNGQIRVEMHSKDSIESCGPDDATSEAAGCAGFDETSD